MPKAKTPRFHNIAELLKDLGGITPERICYAPAPGTATARDLIRLHGRTGLYELVEGTLIEKPMGRPESFVAVELARHVGRFLDAQDLGYCTGADDLIEVMPELVRGPDFTFTSWDKRPTKTVDSNPISQVIPDLTVEVLSPGNTPAEIARKLKEYFFAGVRSVWVIDPRKRIAASYTAPDAKTEIPADGTLDGGDVLPGFSLPLAKLFERLEKPPTPKPKKKR